LLVVVIGGHDRSGVGFNELDGLNSASENNPDFPLSFARNDEKCLVFVIAHNLVQVLVRLVGLEAEGLP